MSVTTTYKCDRCSTEQATPEQFWKLRVELRSYKPFGNFDSSFAAKEAQWCRKCVETVHLAAPYQHVEDKEPVPPAPTFEEMLREIVREEIQTATGAA
jgi:hypothetical protein